MLAERWAFGGPVAASALAAFAAHDAAAHEQLARGARAVVDAGHVAIGLTDRLEVNNRRMTMRNAPNDYEKFAE